MIATHRSTNPLTLADLPGPDTVTKQAAIDTSDIRLQRMLNEAASTGWPRAYTDDLYRHDAERLASHPGSSMLWILRENGTHLYPLHCENSHEAWYYRRVVDYWSGDHKLNVAGTEAERARYYIVSENTLEPVTADEARERITTQS